MAAGRIRSLPVTGSEVVDRGLDGPSDGWPNCTEADPTSVPSSSAFLPLYAGRGRGRDPEAELLAVVGVVILETCAAVFIDSKRDIVECSADGGICLAENDEMAEVAG